MGRGFLHCKWRNSRETVDSLFQSWLGVRRQPATPMPITMANPTQETATRGLLARAEQANPSDVD